MAGRRDDWADRGLAGKIAALAEDLERYLYRQFQLGHLLKGAVCPGEHRCATEGGERVHERRRTKPDLPVLSVCYPEGEDSEKKCSAIETKPELRPPELQQAIAAAYGLAAGKRTTYQWPDSLCPIQWACLRAYERAEARWTSHLERVKAQQSQAQDHIGHLAQLAHR